MDCKNTQTKITKNDLIKILENFNTPLLLSSGVHYTKSMSKKELYDIVVRNTYTLDDYKKYGTKGYCIGSY
jgi:sialic acid synthase SpsE